MDKRQEIVEVFTRLGFETMPDDVPISGLELSVFGTIDAENYDVGKNHFEPRYRSVYFGEAVGGFYITSSIHGKMRLYRCRKTEDTQIANIFGKGKTIEAALKDFAHNFKNKIYNKSGG